MSINLNNKLYVHPTWMVAPIEMQATNKHFIGRTFLLCFFFVCFFTRFNRKHLLLFHSYNVEQSKIFSLNWNTFVAHFLEMNFMPYKRWFESAYECIVSFIWQPESKTLTFGCVKDIIDFYRITWRTSTVSIYSRNSQNSLIHCIA